MGALLFAVASMHLWVDIESTVGQSRSWTVIDLASHPLRADVLLQSLSVNLGGHALVYDGETILRDHGSPGQSQGRRGGDVLRIEPEVSGSEAVNLRDHHEWMRQECSGPFTSLAVLDDNTLLVVGRQKQGNRRVEVLFLLQRVASDWWCWPLLTEGVEKKGVVLRCFRGVWGASGQGSRDGVLQNSCWIWGLCSSSWGWQDRQWKLTWDVSVRPVQVKVELTDLQSGGFSIPTELESFSLKQLDRRGLLKTGVEQHLQKSLIPAVGQSRPQQSCSNALAAKVRCDPQPAHLCHIGLRRDNSDHPDDSIVYP